jgi:hypothetical protein
VYVVVFYKHLNQTDVSLLLLATIGLFWAFTKGKQMGIEDFANNNIAIDLTEDYSSIARNLVQYFTIYDDASYKDGRKTWQSLVKNNEQKDCDTRLLFSKYPSFFLQNGISLFDNIVKGPLSNTTGIKFGKPFTVCIAFIPGQLVKSDEGNIEIIKSYANTSNNNGYSLYIPRSSITTDGGANFGSLFFQFADNEPVACKLSAKDDKINFPINTLCFFVIVRTSDKVRVLYMNEKEDKVNELASIPTTATDATFSNKQMYVNRFGNWNANLLNIAMYNSNLDDIAVLKYYMYIKDLYTKYNNPAYLETVAKFEEAMNKAKELRSCPFPIPVCKSCSTIKDWSNMNDILNAPSKCKKEIGNFCSKNPEHSFCYCWDKSNSKYESQTCQLMRAMFSGNPGSLCQSMCNVAISNNDNVTLEDLSFDKMKITQVLPISQQTINQGESKPLNFWQRLVNAFTW